MTKTTNLLAKTRLIAGLLGWQIAALTIMLLGASLAMDPQPRDTLSIAESKTEAITAQAETDSAEARNEPKLDLEFPDFSIGKPWR